MAVTVLVDGLLRFDSGKTWFGVGLCLCLRRLGYRVGVFKPVAGHSVWGQLWSFRESLRRGFLVGGDVLTYERFLGVDPLAVNPVDLLLAPPDPAGGVSGFLSSVGGWEDQVVVARVPVGGGFEHWWFPVNVSRLSPLVRFEVSRLVGRVGAVPGSVEGLLDYVGGLGGVFEEFRRRVSAGCDFLVVESFNDALVPYRELVGVVDYLVVVAPGRVFVFEGERLRLLASVVDVGGARVGGVWRHLGRPIGVFELPLVEDPVVLADFLGGVVGVLGG
ncbi:MAG: hypothetical protein GXO09_04155 [Crenarchaeota archaeon]|nr:hypothetical protein [Thermoproteota archaeon]